MRLPSAQDLQTVGIRRDPGVRVPNIPSAASGLVDAGNMLSDAAGVIHQEVQKQQKKYDASATSEAILAADRQSAEEYTRVQKEDDPSRPDFISDRKKWLEKRNQDIIASLPSDVSEAARSDLSEKLQRDALTWEMQYAEDNVKALDTRAANAFSGIVSKYEANVAKKP